MHPSELLDELTEKNGLHSDRELARLIGLTPSRISQMRSRTTALTARQVASYIRKAEERGRSLAFCEPIRPIVEFFPIEVVPSRQDAKCEL